MRNHIIRTTSCSSEQLPDLGNRFLIGNGYMGIRGTMEEYSKEQLVAVNLAGIYDRFGDGWRESLNAPNPFWLRLYVNETLTALPAMAPAVHSQELDILSGIHRRTTEFINGVTLRTERFAHMKNQHLLCMKAILNANRPVQLQLHYGIDADVWDIHGPHYAEMALGETDGILSALGTTNEGDAVAVCAVPSINVPNTRNIKIQHLKQETIFTFSLEANTTAELTVVACIFTSKESRNPLEAARSGLHGRNYETLKTESADIWRNLWDTAAVDIDGDDEAELAMNYSLYHLMSIAPRHASSLSVPARGLSGQTYKGAVFWDTEMFMLDFYLATLPDVAKTVLRYRIDTLQGAKAKAAAYGYRGAFYAWESQDGGVDACSDYNVTDVFTGRKVRTYFKDKQIHITAAIIYGLWKYERWTQDDTLWLEGGFEVLIEAARFYRSRLVRRADSDVLELLDVIGTDEYHERVNNNAYTNEMARFVFRLVGELCMRLRHTHPPVYRALEQKLAFTDELPLFAESAQNLKRQEPNENGVIEQFDGYSQLEDATLDEVKNRLKDPREYWGGACGVASDTQIIKQADVEVLLYLLPDAYPTSCLAPNYQYYLPRTEHGSSLSACMYALNACKLSLADDAYPLFMKSARADLQGGGKEWAGLVYIGGIHPAAAGGAYMTLLWGFLGLVVNPDGLSFFPQLPKHWQAITIRFLRNGKLYKVKATQTSVECKEIVRNSNVKSF